MSESALRGNGVELLGARILDGERQMTAIRPVWAADEPNWRKWSELEAEYRAAVDALAREGVSE